MIKGESYRQSIAHLLILTLGMFLIFAHSDRQIILAQEENQPDAKDAALEELQTIKENQTVYQSQLSELLKKSLAIENQYDLIQKRYQKTKNAAQKAGDDILANKILAENMRLERKRLISELYILTNDPLYFVLSFLDTDKFMSRLHGKDENTIVVSEKIKKVIEINDLLKELADQEQALTIKKQAYRDQAQKLAQEALKIQQAVAAKENSLSGLSSRRFNLERYLVDLEKLTSNLKRDFVGWNSATGPVFEFVGGGTEHGLGLSQYGAKGMSEAGKNYREILAHYYQGTKIGRINSNPQVRIGLVLHGAGYSLKIIAGAYQIHQFKISAGERLQVSSNLISLYRQGQLAKKFALEKTERILPLKAESIIQLDYKSSYFNQYTGEIRLIKNGQSLTTVNVLRLEEYLKGVVVAEVPHNWPKEAIKAQALAARSYAIRHLKKTGSYDMDDSTAFQVYIGAFHRARSTHAVEETRGEVVTFAGQIIPTYYFSTSGGYTENNENIWGGKPLPYLRGVESPWEESSPWWTWYTKKYSRGEISRLLASLSCGQIKKLAIVNRGVSGRVLAVKIVGSQGVRIISGAHFKDLINSSLGPDDQMMRSTLFGVRSIK